MEESREYIMLGKAADDAAAARLDLILRHEYYFGLEIERHGLHLVLVQHKTNPYPPATINRMMSFIDAYNNLHIHRFTT